MPVYLPKLIRRHPTIVTIYALFALHSLLFQAVVRLEQCVGWRECASSLAKDVAWSVVWPIYWLAYFR